MAIVLQRTCKIDLVNALLEYFSEIMYFDLLLSSGFLLDLSVGTHK